MTVIILQLLPLLLLVLPHSKATQCTIGDLEITSETLTGRYVRNGWTISFRANHESRSNNISSLVTFQDSTNTKSPAITSLLSFAFTADKKVPEIRQLIVDSAVKVLQDRGDLECTGFSESRNQLYQEFASALFNCTTSMGFSQLRFSVMYHVSIVGTAERICRSLRGENVTICSHSPEYDLGNQLFMCAEDMRELFPSQAQEERDNLARFYEDQKPIEEPTALRKKIFISASSLTVSPCLLQGGDLCCCGNYAGCCWFASIFCCAHDIVCINCEYWFCGPHCVPI